MSNPLILLIEDEPADILLTQRAFRKGEINADVHIITDGLEAIDYLFGSSQQQDELSLILLDLHLPRVSGLHILRRIRENEFTRPLPVVVLTSSELTEDREQSKTLGANMYMEKPITPGKLISAIEDLGIDSLTHGDG